MPSDKQAEVLAAVGVRADSATHMQRDFNRGRQLNPNLKLAVWHTSLSFNPDDAPRLDSAKMRAVAEDYVRKMGLDQTQYVIVRHHDQPDNQHLHIIANRVGNDGKTIADGQNFFRSKKVLIELTREHGLTPPKGLRPDKQHPTQLRGVDKTRHEIREALRTVLASATDSKGFYEGLRGHGVDFQIYTTKDKRPAGISFAKDGQTFKGSAVHRSFSLTGITSQVLANQAAQQATQALAARQVEKAKVGVGSHPAARQPTAAPKQVPKGPELSAAERKWQASYQASTAKLAQVNATIQAYNQLVDSYSQHLKAQPAEEGVERVLKAINNDPPLAALRAELERQLAARAYHAAQWALSYGRQAELEKRAKGNFLGYKNAQAKEAAQMLEYLHDPNKALPELLQPRLLEFARAAKVAAQSLLAIGFEAKEFYQPEKVAMSLTEYAAKREAERKLVVRVRELDKAMPAAERAEILQRALNRHGAATAVRHSVDAEGRQVSEVAIGYSWQLARGAVKEISLLLDWVAKQPGHELQESELHRTQRQAPGLQDAQREQTPARTQRRHRGHRL
ncbi:relaxase/mobilization nuclease domain-containing protein [Hymenobacter sp. YC55]|uniref:relaxase/mobilization nuclease domain-containing protein n=1 Tax=Hymenobacter sp. YC55 TaxID=3034019 RepID=UPI0023F72CAE|nr:relaxase/mobilization nuclease domain-containing protein [Hymenobacter sp. YC55]MDF7815739.1 relaxase/mobilization nuclease domain-containing protein [Hymenobacter sp. YC55]